MNIGVTFNLKYNWTICTNYKKTIDLLCSRILKRYRLKRTQGQVSVSSRGWLWWLLIETRGQTLVTNVSIIKSFSMPASVFPVPRFWGKQDWMCPSSLQSYQRQRLHLRRCQGLQESVWYCNEVTCLTSLIIWGGNCIFSSVSARDYSVEWS